MPVSNSPLAYSDVKALLDRALETERGLRVQSESKAAAWRLVMRLNKFRVIERDALRRVLDPDHPLYGTCEYDQLSFRRIELDSRWFVELEKIGSVALEVTEL